MLRVMQPYTIRLKHRTAAAEKGGSSDGEYLERVRRPVLVTGASADAMVTSHGAAATFD